MRTAATLLGLLLAITPALAGDTPRRDKGISMHMLPKQVADMGGRRWGLVVTYADYLMPEPAEPVLQSATEVVAFARKQDPKVQANGIWIVTTHPDAYSDMEKRVLDDVKAFCRRERIALFIARGSELPSGWQRY